MFQLLSILMIFSLVLSFWVPYRRSGIQHGLISFFSVLFGLVVGILILYWLLVENVIVINLLFGGTSKGLGFIPVILLLSPIAGYFLLRPLVIEVLRKMKIGKRKKIAFLIITILILVIGIDFTIYQVTHEGLWDSGFRNYIYSRFGIFHANLTQ